MLDEQFSDEETRRQLETAVNWGRYAELFDYDAARRRFVLPETRRERRSRSRKRRPRPCKNRQHLRAQPRPGAHLAGLPRPDRRGFLSGRFLLGHLRRPVLVQLPRAGSGHRRSPSALPLYAFYSIVRTVAAYFLSLIFAVGYGYIAAYNKRVEPLMIAVLDILQSIPVLSFLPGVMLAMVALIPGRQLGIEFGRHRAHLHRPGVEHGVQLLFLAEEHSARIARGLRASTAIRPGSASGNWSFPFQPSA